MNFSNLKHNVRLHALIQAKIELTVQGIREGNIVTGIVVEGIEYLKATNVYVLKEHMKITNQINALRVNTLKKFINC